MDEKRAEELRAFSSEVQKDILRMVGVARSGPFEISMTTADLLVYLYWKRCCFRRKNRGAPTGIVL